VSGERAGIPRKSGPLGGGQLVGAVGAKQSRAHPIIINSSIHSINIISPGGQATKVAHLTGRKCAGNAPATLPSLSLASSSSAFGAWNKIVVTPYYCPDWWSKGAAGIETGAAGEISAPFLLPSSPACTATAPKCQSPPSPWV
jgi:hypothetical protein